MQKMLTAHYVNHKILKELINPRRISNGCKEEKEEGDEEDSSEEEGNEA